MRKWLFSAVLSALAVLATCNDEHGVLDFLLPTGNTPKTVNTGELFISKQEDTF